MNRTGFKVMMLVMTLGGLVVAPAYGQESLRSGLDKCASISNAAERLFCFDSLAAGQDDQARANNSVAPTPSASMSASGSSPVAAARPTRPVVNPDNTGSTDFGLELEQVKQGPQTLTSRYAGAFTGWTGDTVFQLQNGQVWKQVETGRLSFRAENPVITIRRGWFGAFYLKVEGANKQVRVKRIK
ncbi:MAG: hypothetical protein HKN59_04160 [Gammaproteobacteria bacterium]|nr:hypothetical protein [Gammaproteobacteria bacterium]